MLRDNNLFRVVYLENNYNMKKKLGNSYRELHDRYIFTNQCGIISTNGWDISESGTKHTTLSILSREDYANIYHAYQNENLHIFVKKFDRTFSLHD